MKKLQRGFTLIELLVVVGIIAVLAIAALIAINPIEAQRKARDATRLKDLSTLQTILTQFIDDNGVAAAFNVTSTVAGASNNCNGGWLGTGRNFCNYINVIPLDPSNGKMVGFVNATGDRQPGAIAGYRVNVTATGEYGISVRLESATNALRLNGDGIADGCVSAYSAVTAVICP